MRVKRYLGMRTLGLPSSEETKFRDFMKAHFSYIPSFIPINGLTVTEYKKNNLFTIRQAFHFRSLPDLSLNNE